MGFFEDAVSKTKEIVDVARQKTSEAVIIEKQRFTIASLKSKREKDYAELGRIYFKLINEDTELDNNTSNLIDAINEKNREIARLSEEIENIKNK